ncbi:pectate lyase-like adhesive domain-containing protein [Limosilactobacillus coleohominis]|uniref:pectate lyase-like adhesive domain-containing protein n=1 Tax=Limosilactobacillus coleohominis TaxID=181675 RepID=UPI0002FE1921|nr:pectate lyase-like adhesive domain-containing protein [Limosilactobacillus coleohominis]
MLSSNNQNEYLRKQEPKKQRFAIKKLTVGVASVLIGFTFMGLNASANTNTNTTTTPAGQETAATNDGNSTASNTDQEQPVDQPTTNGDQQNTNRGQETTDAATLKQETNDQQVTPQPATNPVTPSQVDANKTATVQNSQDVSSWSEFVNALNDANVNQINLTGDITVTGKVDGISTPKPVADKGYLNLNQKGIARKVTIEGNSHSLDFGKYSLKFTNNNQK